MAGWDEGEGGEDMDGIPREAKGTVDGVKRTIGLNSRLFNSAVSEIVEGEDLYIDYVIYEGPNWKWTGGLSKW